MFLDFKYLMQKISPEIREEKKNFENLNVEVSDAKMFLS